VELSLRQALNRAHDRAGREVFSLHHLEPVSSLTPRQLQVLLDLEVASEELRLFLAGGAGEPV
jgi:hypothetical protein